MNAEADFSRGTWLNKPTIASVNGPVLSMQTDLNTDFWRQTHYGFIRDNGHFLGIASQGDFTAEVRVNGRYEHLYDQAGLMVRIDERHWIKTGVELNDGAAVFSTVVTAINSDWSVTTLACDPADFWLRVTVASGALRVQASADRKIWPLLRLAPIPLARSYLVGPMACTPERQGLKVAFSDFVLGPPTMT